MQCATLFTAKWHIWLSMGRAMGLVPLFNTSVGNSPNDANIDR